jgi:hypothetical protein
MVNYIKILYCTINPCGRRLDGFRRPSTWAILALFADQLELTRKFKETHRLTHRLHRRLSVAVLFLLLFWLTRLIAIEQFPLFLDETTHIDLGERTLTTSPFYDADLGRVFAGWLQYAVQSYANEPVWVARVATVLAVLPGVAAVLAIGHLAAGLWGLGLAGLFYLFSAYHLFFERLALADPRNRPLGLQGGKQ